MSKAKKSPALLIYEFLSSIKLAVIVILGLTLSLATATILESLYDTPTAQFFVYRALWFHGVLALLAVNIFMVMVSRWPWKKGHIPFLLAHIGILSLLGGSWLTDHYGLDGQLRVSEGESTSVVEMDRNQLVFGDGRVVLVPWSPPGYPFKPFSLRSRGVPIDLTVTEFLPHADAEFSFVPETSGRPQGSLPPSPALKIRISGGPMKITQDLWLWSGDRSFAAVSAGPAQFFMVGHGQKTPTVVKGRPVLVFAADGLGNLTYRAQSSAGKITTAHLTRAQVRGTVIHPDWKTVEVSLLEWVPQAIPLTHYSPARIEYGPQAPPPAVKLVHSGGAETWLGVGDRAVTEINGKPLEIGFAPHRLILPFSVKLNRFTIERYQGTVDPASYQSQVTVFGSRQDPRSQTPATISMNEPLEHDGITLYQSSFEDADPRPVTSIFSINRDPGRPWKYGGSLLLVLGSILLFAKKYVQKKRVTA